MFDLIFLGTSSSAPSVHRGLPAHIVLHRHYRFLLDCGEGTQRQLLQSGLGFRRMERVLLTHGHLDHILGLGGLISTLSRWESLESLEIYGSKETLKRVSNLLFGVVFWGTRPPLDIQFCQLEPGVVLEDDKFALSAFPVSHRGSDSYGFLFAEKSRRPFLPEKAEALAIPFGPVRSQLVRGETVTLPDGRIIHPDDVLGELIPGVKYVHIGDVGHTDGLAEICQDADALVIEATYTAAEADMAREFGHLTATAAAQLARDANVKSLILTHLSRRHQDREVRQEARAIFRDTFIARDFDHFQIVRGGAVRLKKEES